LFECLQGDSLIFEHQWQLEKLQRLTECERTRHWMSLRERLGFEMNPNASFSSERALPNVGMSLDKSEKDACNLAMARGRAAAAAAAAAAAVDPYAPWDMTPREKEVAEKYLRLMTYHVHK